MDSKRHTAIIIFTRLAEEELYHKRFTPSRHADLGLVRQLISHSVGEAKKTSHPVFIFSSECQRGDTFGERLAHAFQCVFDQGYATALAIGNDCPALSSQLMLEAVAMLERGDGTVAGPAGDGGVYLLGMHRSVFSRSAFEALPWQSPALYAALLPQLQGKLPLLNDADDFRSLKATLIELARHLGHLGSWSLLARLKALLSVPLEGFGKGILCIIDTVQRQYQFRLRPPPGQFPQTLR